VGEAKAYRQEIGSIKPYSKRIDLGHKRANIAEDHVAKIAELDIFGRR